MGTRGDHRHQDRIGGKDVEQRQRAEDDVVGLEQQAGTIPAVVDHAGSAVLGDLGHAGGAAGVEIGGNAVGGIIGEIKGIGAVFRAFGVEIEVGGGVGCGVFRADEIDDQGLREAKVAGEVNLQHGGDIGGLGHGLGDALRQFGLGEGAQGDDDFGTGFAQDGGDLVGFQQGVDRVDDTGDGAGQKADGGLCRVGQDIGDDITGADAKAAEQIGGLGDFAVQLVPGQGFGFITRPGLQLKAEGGTRAVGGFGARQKAIHRGWQVAGGPGAFGLDRANVGKAAETAHISPNGHVSGLALRQGWWHSRHLPRETAGVR